MTPVLSWLSNVLPLSYAIDAMQRRRDRALISPR
jgi:hypothetical protein